MKVKSYQDLTVWQKAMKMAELVYGMTASFPASETYGLSSQMRRAAVSIASNIAEGASKASTREYVHFLGISYGSAGELETQLLLANRIGYISDGTETLNLLEEIKRMLSGLDKSLRNK